MSKINKKVLIVVGLTIPLLIISVLLLSNRNDSRVLGVSTMENNNQVITINVRNGYIPNDISAKGGVPTTLKFVTKNTYDCSSIIVIPELGINKSLPSHGITDIAINSQMKGSSITGSCGNGSYGFIIRFS